jgi:glutathione synthase/RimK-type ligase-like ATP-grasp enzyme
MHCVQGQIALATCEGLPNLDPDDGRLIGLLAQLGLHAVPAVWDDPTMNWPAFDLVVLRSTWDYPARHEAFLDWVGSLQRVLNPAAVMRWNADKRYLRQLAGAGVPTVLTTFLDPGEDFRPPTNSFVVKPAVGAGSKDAARYDPEQAEAAAAHVRRIHRSGKAVLVQPYLERVDREGETGLVFLGGRYSHAIHKGGMLGSVRRAEGPLFLAEEIRPHLASTAERLLAERALAAVPDSSHLLYARVDLLPADDGTLVLSEIELIEPSLYLGHGSGSAEHLARLIAQALRTAVDRGS